MLTKGDVLAYLGKASGPLGTYKELATEPANPRPGPAKVEKKEEYKVTLQFSNSAHNVYFTLIM